jgi:DNA-binding beta-propeller fold protein YncE
MNYILLDKVYGPSEVDCTANGIPVRRNTTAMCPRRQKAVPPGVRLSPKSAAADQPTYPLRPVLDLPFGAISSDTDAINTLSCSPPLPDVLIVSQGNSRLIRLTACPTPSSVSISVADTPVQVAVTPDASTALVTSFSGVITFVDLATNRAVFRLSTGNDTPTGIDISPDGAKAYVTSFSSTDTDLLTIDIAARAILSRTPIGAFAESVVLTPDGSQAWITYPQGVSVQVFDLASMSQVANVPVSSNYSIAFNSTGTRAYITSQGGSPGQVAEVDAASYQVLKRYNVGTGPFDIVMAYGDTGLIVTNILDPSASYISLRTGDVTTVKLTGEPRGLSPLR